MKKTKGPIIFASTALFFLIFSIFIIYMSLKRTDMSLIEQVSIMIKVAIPCSIGSGWVCYSAYKYKIKPLGGVDIKARITLEATAIMVSLFLLLNLIVK